MSADSPAEENNKDATGAKVTSAIASNNNDVAEQDVTSNKDVGHKAHMDTDELTDEDGDDEEEPKLKYAKLTGSLANVYRNGDSTSAFIVAGDKMVVGTHSGSIHVSSIPTLQTLRTYRAHQASVTSVSVSPVPPPPVLMRAEGGNLAVFQPASSTSTTAAKKPPATNNGRSTRTTQSPPQVIPNTPSNNIYIATSSLDGHVCIQSLVNVEDVQLRNFARPVNAVALSPDYKNDRTYLSGGLAGNLIMTVGGKSGVSTDANTNSAAAAASGWLGAIGLGSNTGRDQILHSGEGAISSIKWSLSGKWVAWINEEGIKVMRSHLKLGSEDSEDAWRRIAHAQKPNKKIWEEMAGVWKGRCEWVDDKSLEADEQIPEAEDDKAATSKTKKSAKFEKLVVGWGDTAWLLHVHSTNATTSSGKRQVGSADIIHKLHFVDCIVSGIAFYTPTLLAILAYRTRDDNDKPLVAPAASGKEGNAQTAKAALKGRQHRHTGLAPQLRLVNVINGEEVDLDELSNISRFETLSSQDYHLGTVYIPPPAPQSTKAAKDTLAKGALEGIWDAASGVYVSRIFTSATSVRSNDSPGRASRAHSFISQNTSSGKDVTATPEPKKKPTAAHPYALEAGLKLFMLSPYDCVLAVRRELTDHLAWLLERQQYANAWHLIDKHPNIADKSASAVDQFVSAGSKPGSPTKSSGTEQQGQKGSLADFFADDNSSQFGGGDGSPFAIRRAEQEKRRIGQLWLAQLIADDNWVEAGKIAGKVLGNSNRWEHWVWTFAQAEKFDEITPYIPATNDDQTPLPSRVYEVVLGHYIFTDRKRLAQLLDQWDPELFDVRSVISTIEERLASDEVAEDSNDWRILMESLAKLYLADGRARDALRCYIRLQDADRAFALVREAKLLDTVTEDIPGLIMLRISKQQIRSAPLSELEEGTSEAIQLLADEAQRGTVPTAVVIDQLQRKGDAFQPFLYFYLRALWNSSKGTVLTRSRWRNFGAVDDGHALVDDFADLAVSLFAEYDRPLLLTFIQKSERYSLGRATEIFERRHYIPELVHILSKTGETKRALSLIIGELGDVKQAIGFAKEHPDLWGDLLDYSMDKPTFITGLLEEVGAVSLGSEFDPIDVVRRIPEGLEIEGLKRGLWKFIREFEIQMSISEGVARVLRGEVTAGMDILRAGRRKGVSFQVIHETANEVEIEVKDVPLQVSEKTAIKLGDDNNDNLPTPQSKSTKRPASAAIAARKAVQPGHCSGCEDVFHEDEKQILLGFTCGHVYHLPCLIDAHPDTKDSSAARAMLVQLEDVTADDGDGGGTRSVGAKVAHAQVIRNVLGQMGCARCRDLAERPPSSSA
jgi:hypothetical protein